MRHVSGRALAPVLLTLLLSGTSATQAAWQATGPWGGSATALALHGSTLLAGSHNSLLYRSDDEARHWRRLPFPRHFLGTVTSLVINPLEPRLYLAGLALDHAPEAGLWLSEDEGEHWRQAEGLAGISVQALAVFRADPRIVVAGTRDGVWRSADSGRTWSRLSAPYLHELRAVTAIGLHPTDPNIVYAGTTHLPWRTTDGGKSWHSIETGMLDDSDVFSIHIDARQPARLLASACSGIYRSESAGSEWKKFAGIPASHRRTHAIISPADAPDTIYAGTTLGLLKSTNAGATFRQVNQLEILALALDPAQPRRLWLATRGGGIFLSEDGGETVQARNEGFGSRRVSLLAQAGNVLFASVQQEGAAALFRSTDGLSWRQAGRWSDETRTLLAGCPTDAALLFSGNENQLARSRDGGQSWTPLRAPAARLRAIACLGTAGHAELLLATDRGLFRSTDNGAAWQPARLTAANIQHDVVALTTSARSATRVIARTTQAVYLSEDTGHSWKVLNILFPARLINDLALDGENNGPLLAATAQGLYVSTDSGRTWQLRESGLQPGTVNALATHPGRAGLVFAVQFERMYYSSSGGRDWSLLPASELPQSTLRRLLVWPASDSGTPDRLLGATPDLGILALAVR